MHSGHYPFVFEGKRELARTLLYIGNKILMIMLGYHEELQRLIDECSAVICM